MKTETTDIYIISNQKRYYWDNDNGWTYDKNVATVFTEEDTKTLNLPIDGWWVLRKRLDPKLYKKAYFFIKAGYVWGKGMSPEKNAIFEEEIRRILSDLGFINWTKSGSGSAWTGYRGIEKLYCHPMDLVGPVKPESIPEIVEALKQANTFSFTEVNVYELTEKEINYNYNF